MTANDCTSTFDVSIGICVKNSEITIKEAIVSLVNQSFDKKKMEIIVIDDGCKDQTIPIITNILSKEQPNTSHIFNERRGINYWQANGHREVMC